MKKEIKEGDKIPNWYAISYRDFQRDVYVCYPIVIHLVIKYFISFHWWAIKFNPSKRDKELKKAYENGKKIGRLVGYNEAFEVLRKRLDERGDHGADRRAIATA